MPGLLIVDDEAYVRRAVHQIIAEGGLDLGPLVEASSGEEAVSLAHEMRPDIVLMDVKIPGLDGLESIRRIRADHPGVKAIMLTAYDEFSFAQEGIKLGVVDYLLKPIRPSTLIEVLSRVRARVREEETLLLETEVTRSRLQETLPLAEAELLNALIQGTFGDQAAVNRILSHLGKTIHQPAVIVVGLDRCYSAVQNMEIEQANCFSGWLPDIVRETVPDSTRCLIGSLGPRVLAAIVSTDQELADVSQIRALGEAMRHALKMRALAYCPRHCTLDGATVTATVGIGRGYSNLDSVPLSYAEALRAQWHKLYLGRDSVIHIDDVDVTESGGLLYPFEYERELLSAVRQGNRQSGEEIMGRLLDHLLDRPGAPPESVHTRLLELMVLISRATIDAGAPSAEVLDMSHHQVAAIARLQTKQEIRAWAGANLASFMGRVRPASYSHRVVEQAIEYMVRNQHRPDLGLEEIAGAVHVSPSHLAHLFKTRMGTSCVRYLTALRVEEAKRLLRTTGMTIAAVAAATGYDDRTYFHRVFRRETGTTPTAYRELSHSDREIK